VDVLASQFLRAAQSADIDIIVYCFMPDHVHLIADARAASWPLPRFMKQAKQLSGFHGRRVIDARVWQPGYFDRVLGVTEDVRVAIAYVLNNPVRRGLVASPGDYPFSGSGICLLAPLIDHVRTYL
jgi:putative transposase